MSESTPDPKKPAAPKGKQTGETITEKNLTREKAEQAAKESAKDTTKQLKADVLLLCDEFSQFSDECAFHCEAFAAIVREPEALDQATIAGCSHYSIWLKEQVAGFKHRICKLHKELGQ